MLLHHGDGGGIEPCLEVVEQQLDALDPDFVEHLGPLLEHPLAALRRCHSEPVPGVEKRRAQLVGLALALAHRPQLLDQRPVADTDLCAKDLALVGFDRSLRGLRHVIDPVGVGVEVQPARKARDGAHLQLELVSGGQRLVRGQARQHGRGRRRIV